MSRWTLKDTVTNEVYTMPINPDSMTSPEPDRNLSFGPGWRLNSTRNRTHQTPSDAKEWQFSGPIRTQAHHDALFEWATRDVPVEVSDHLGRTYRVVISQLNVTERRPTKTVPWRLRYEMTTRIVRRVT
jgi:hypothetical protein